YVYIHTLAVHLILNVYFSYRALISDQTLADFGVRLTLHRLSVNRHYAIAKAKAGASGGRAIEGCANVGVDINTLAKIPDGCADTKVFRTLFCFEQSVFDRIEIGAMWVEP